MDKVFESEIEKSGMKLIYNGGVYKADKFTAPLSTREPLVEFVSIQHESVRLAILGITPWAS